MACGSRSLSQNEWYMQKRTLITNGVRAKELFDCKRALRGYFFDENDDPSKAFSTVVQPDTLGETEYIKVCSVVMHEMPYLPDLHAVH